MCVCASPRPNIGAGGLRPRALRRQTCFFWLVTPQDVDACAGSWPGVICLAVGTSYIMYTGFWSTYNNNNNNRPRQSQAVKLFRLLPAKPYPGPFV